jgi:hypothetical protein
MILQRNLNRSTFVVWEMKRNVSVVCVCSAPNFCDTEQRSASQPACFLRDAPLCWSLCHLAEGAYTIWLLFVSVSVMCEFTQGSWKMYRYTLEKWVYIVRTYWKTESIKSCQQQCLEKLGGKWWPLPAHVMMSSHFSHKERTPVQIGVRIIKEMPGSVVSGTLCITEIKLLQKQLINSRLYQKHLRQWYY